MQPTRFHGIPRRARLAILCAACALTVWGAIVTWSWDSWPLGGIILPDLDLYHRIVLKVHNGAGYYHAAQSELGGVRSVFNVRLPTYGWMLGALPDPELGFWLLLLLAVASVIAAVRCLLAADSSRFMVVATIIFLLGGSFTWCVIDREAFYSTEPWCESLLLLSLCAYAKGRWRLGVLSAALALSLRELVLPYCLVAAGFSLRCGRRYELIVWMLVLALFALGMFGHAAEVTRRIPGMAGAAVGDWLRASGLHFAFRASAMNIFLRPLPPFLLACVLPLAMLGLAGWKGEIGRRVFLSAAIYVVAFLFITGGDYWGLLYTPMIVLGLLRSPAALRDLLTESSRGSSTTA